MNEKFGNILEEFTNTLGNYCAFTDDGIVCKNTSTNRFFPYGSIEEIGFGLGSLHITGEVNGEPQCFLYVPVDKQQKARIKKLISFAKSKMKNAPKEDVIEITPKKTGKAAERAARNAVAQAHAAKAVAMMDTEKRTESNTYDKEIQRNKTGKTILLISIVLIIIGCAASAAWLGLFAVIGFVIGFIITMSNRTEYQIQQEKDLAESTAQLIIAKAIARERIDLDDTPSARVASQKEETKQIVKGAVIGSIVAGDAGAVVGATIAKNKIDRTKIR